MYVGHFAAGLAIKARVPRAPTWGILLGVALMDVLFGVFLLTGIERAHLTPGVPPGFRLDFIDWSHSLTMSIVWAALFGLAWRGRGRAVAWTMGFAVFSHFLLDLVVHVPDLALWPGSGTHLGLGLWTAMPTGWWFVELGVIAAGWTYYWRRSRAEGTFGGHAFWIALVLLVLHVLNSPWLSAT